MVDSINCRAMLEDIGDAQSPHFTHFTILKEKAPQLQRERLSELDDYGP